jgi:hypothetical protein
MTDIANIENNEVGLSVREKLNLTIAQANKLKDLPAAKKIIGNLSGNIADATQVSVDIAIDGTADHISLPTTKAAKDYTDARVTASTTQVVNDPNFLFPSISTASSSAAIKAYVDSITIGINQKWQISPSSGDIGQGVFGGLYPNNSTKGIMLTMYAYRDLQDDVGVNIRVHNSDTTYQDIQIVLATNSGGGIAGSVGVAGTGSIIIPAGASYQFKSTGDSITTFAVWELS